MKLGHIWPFGKKIQADLGYVVVCNGWSSTVTTKYLYTSSNIGVQSQIKQTVHSQFGNKVSARIH
jgi:hypothetical protein